MHKIKTLVSYFKDFIKWGEYRYVLTSAKYILFNKTTSKTRIYNSSLGTFLCRKGTLDFQFANLAYEWNVKEFIYQHEKECDVFFDIGANIGTYSILMAKKNKKVIAFEPIRSNYNALCINAMLNNVEDKITCYPFALGDKAENAEFVFDLLNTGASHKAGIELDDVLNDPEEKETVKIIPLDDIIKELNIKKSDRLFLKIDVEGMEEKVLKGAANFIHSFPNILIVMESVHSGKDKLEHILNEIDPFEIIPVDNLNIGARKKKN